LITDAVHEIVEPENPRMEGISAIRHALSLFGTVCASGSKRNEICLPSLRRLDEGFFIKCDTVIHLLRSGNAMVAVPPPPKRSSLSPVPDDPPELNAALTESAVEI
jgi:hypothetical protein